MGAFEYQAVDAGGRARRGVLEADSSRQARAALRQQGLLPLEIAELHGSRDVRAATSPRLKARELAVLTRQMAALAQAGLPVEEMLQASAEQAGRASLRRLLLEVRGRVLEGLPLHRALDAAGGAFPADYCASVAAGEQSGRLSAVLERLAGAVEARQALRQRVQLALLYPAILTLLSVAIVTGLLLFVVPQVLNAFAQSGQSLPGMTRALLALTGALGDYGPALLGLIAVGGLGLRLALRHEPAALRVHRLLLRVPLLGRQLRETEAARFTRTLGLLLRSGVGLVESLGISARVVQNRDLQRRLQAVAARVREGAGLSRTLAQQRVLPPLAQRLVASGEASGELGALVERAAEQQESDLQNRISLMLGLFETLVLVVMGLVIMLIMVAVLLPLFELNRLVEL